MSIRMIDVIGMDVEIKIELPSYCHFSAWRRAKK